MAGCRRFLWAVSRSTQLLTASSVHSTCCVMSSTLKFQRHWKVNLPKLGQKSKLKSRHSVYRVVGRDKGPKELAVILTEDSIDFGVEGELIDVPKHFGRKLINENKAVYASPENIAEYASKAKSLQTMSGRRMILWLREQGTFACPYRFDVNWTLTPENLARCLLRAHNLVVAPPALTLPDYPITNENAKKDDIHEVKVMINECDTVSIKISITEWNLPAS